MANETRTPNATETETFSLETFPEEVYVFDTINLTNPNDDAAIAAARARGRYMIANPWSSRKLAPVYVKTWKAAVGVLVFSGRRQATVAGFAAWVR